MPNGKMWRSLVVGSLVICSSAVVACSGDRADPRLGAASISDEDIRAYRLTDDGLTRWHDLQMRSAREPALSVAPSRARGAPEGVGGAAASYMVGSFESSPAIAGAIRDGGLDPREFVLISFALYHALAGQGAQALPPGLLTNSENLRFVAANLPRINRYYAQQATARQEALDTAPPRLDP
jgi:hypothetical protein